MKDNDSLLRQYGIKHGLILGLILLIITILDEYFVAYVSSSAVGLFVVLYIIPFLLKLVLAVVFSLWLRKTLGGYWTLKQATTGLFFMFYISFLMGFVGNDILFSRVIDHTTIQRANDKAVVYFRAAQQMSGSPQKDIDTRVKDFQLALNKPLTIGGILSSLVQEILFLFIVSLVFGAIFKREPPLFTQSQEFEDRV